MNLISKKIWRSLWPLALFLIVFAAHLLLVHGKFLSPAEIFDGRPIVNYDYGLHYYDVLKGVDFLNEKFSFTGYDTAFMGGYLKGFIDDASSKLWILFVWIFQWLGVLSAYKLFVYLTIVSMPLLFFAALKVWGFSLLPAISGMALAILYQNTFKLGNFLWVGMITFPLAVYLSFLCMALLKRYFSRGCHTLLAIFTVMAAIAFYSHILAAILIGAVALILYSMHFKKLTKKQHIYFALSPLIVVLVNTPWVLPFLRGLDMKDAALSVNFFQSPGFSQSMKEIFWPFLDTFHSFNIRGALFVLGFFSLIILWKKKRKAAVFITASFAAFSFITYSGLSFLREIQPYRFLIVGDLLLIFAIVYVLRIFELKKTMLALIIAVLLSLQVFPSTFKTGRILANDFGGDHEALVEYFKDLDLKGRVLFEVEHASDAIFFHLETGYEMIGGPYRYMVLRDGGANFTEESLFGSRLNDVSESIFYEGLEKYNIKAIVCHSEKACKVPAGFLQEAAEAGNFGKYKIYLLK